jgi:hypothetical protein
LGLFLFYSPINLPLINSPFIGALLFYIGFNFTPILSPINNYFFLWYTYLLTLYFIALNGLKIAHHFNGGKYTPICVASLRIASHRFALRPHMVEKVHPLWPCEIWQGHTKKCVVGDTKWIRQKHFVHSKGQAVIQFGNVVFL